MPEDNWWTEPLFAELVGMERERLTPLQRCQRRVDYYLTDYEGHFSHHYYADNVTADGRESGGGGNGKEATQATFEEEIAVKADLDRAIRLCTQVQRRFIELCCIGTDPWYRCRHSSDADHELRVFPAIDITAPAPRCQVCGERMVLIFCSVQLLEAGRLVGVSKQAAWQALGRGKDRMATILWKGVDQ